MGRHSAPEDVEGAEPDPALAPSPPDPAPEAAPGPTAPTTGGTRPEPVAISAALQAVLAAAVAVGWVTLDNTAISSIVTAVGAVLALVATLAARRAVTPLAAPRSASGVPLVVRRPTPQVIRSNPEG